MSASDNRRERKKRQAKEIIESSGLKLFLAKGFTDTTVAEIMEAADYGTGTFYNYFKSKEDLLSSIVCEKIMSAQKDIEKLAAESLPVCEKLTKILLTAGQAFEEYRPLILFYIQLRNADPSMEVPLRHGAIFKGMLISIVLEGQSKGEINPNIPTDMIIELLHGILQSALISSNSRLSLTQNISYKLTVLFDGIKPRGGQ